MTEDDLRIISLTPFFSKTFEQIVLDWLLEYVDEQIDSFQYGGRKGTSSNHYLIDLITFILYNQDLPESRAVLATMVDFSKAFNRQNHLILVTKLSDMGVPGWLLKIVIGFLEERQLIVTYNGATSGTKEMPGGGPQGTVLGMFLFLILINKAGIKDQNRRLVSLSTYIRSNTGRQLHLQGHLGDERRRRVEQTPGHQVGLRL